MGDKLKRWLSRSSERESDVGVHAANQENLNGDSVAHSHCNGHSAPSATPSPSKVDRWLARAGHAGPNGSSGSKVQNGTGGVSACCNLIHLMDAEELLQVHATLTSVLEQKGLSPKIQGPATMEEMFAELNQLAKEASERHHAAEQMLAAAKAEKERKQREAEEAEKAEKEKARLREQEASQGDPNSKLNRWLKKTAAAPEPPKPAPPPLPAPASSESKLGRWLKKVEQNPAAPAPGPADAAPGKGEGDVVRRCCAAVRAAWKAADAAAECGGAGAGEWAKLEQEKRALDNLMQMVYAIRSTPAQVTGLTPPPTPGLGSESGPMWKGAPPGPNGMPPGPSHVPPAGESSLGGPGAGPAPVSASDRRVQRVQQSDPDALLAEFLQARRQERQKETKQMVQDKTNPKKENPGKGWRAGSPMASAAKPKDPVHIGLNRVPQHHPPPIMMMGPPPEGPFNGASREDVMSKEGGGGFFYYPPGHPAHVPGSLPPNVEGQLRSSVHPMERIAPHWSEAKFRAQGMPEVICEARHATFGPLTKVQGRLVRCVPPTAHEEIKNVDQVRGNVVYVKRGGCNFTQKARVAQAAGAIAMVVANNDQETFGMSFTDDGKPLDGITIPCVMISSDVCAKLESCKQSPDGRAPWMCMLTPLDQRAGPAFNQHMQLAEMASKLPPGMPLHVRMPPEEEGAAGPGGKGPPGQGGRGAGGPGGKDQSIMKRLKSMLP